MRKKTFLDLYVWTYPKTRIMSLVSEYALSKLSMSISANVFTYTKYNWILIEIAYTFGDMIWRNTNHETRIYSKVSFQIILNTQSWNILSCIIRSRLHLCLQDTEQFLIRYVKLSSLVDFCAAIVIKAFFSNNLFVLCICLTQIRIFV